MTTVEPTANVARRGAASSSRNCACPPSKCIKGRTARSTASPSTASSSRSSPRSPASTATTTLEIRGYQRPEVLSHIASIRRYLESDEPMIPNALVIAFDKRVTFEPDGPDGKHGDVCPGTLVIPIDPDCADEDKPGWVVDGQQRCAAIREARIKSFPICVTAFITDSDAEQRSQFILVNSTKPLPKGLIHELLADHDRHPADGVCSSGGSQPRSSTG